MVHNGIEYGDMQLICEAYHLMKQALGMSNDEMGDVSQLVYYLLSFHQYIITDLKYLYETPKAFVLNVH